MQPLPVQPDHRCYGFLVEFSLAQVNTDEDLVRQIEEEVNTDPTIRMLSGKVEAGHLSLITFINRRAIRKAFIDFKLLATAVIQQVGNGAVIMISDLKDSNIARSKPTVNDLQLQIPGVVPTVLDTSEAPPTNECSTNENGESPFKKAKKNTQECTVKKALALKLNGREEVHTEAGYVDVVTSTEVIEVKHFTFWKHALGQVIAYSYFLPGLTRRVHMFADLRHIEAAKAAAAVAKQVCATCDVAVSLEIMGGMIDL